MSDRKTFYSSQQAERSHQKIRQRIKTTDLTGRADAVYSTGERYL